MQIPPRPSGLYSVYILIYVGQSQSQGDPLIPFCLPFFFLCVCQQKLVELDAVLIEDTLKPNQAFDFSKEVW